MENCKYLQELIMRVRQECNYIEKPYKSIGGMWATYDYKKGELHIQVQDEGYTNLVMAPGLRAVSGYNGSNYVRYEEGDPEMAKYYISKLDEYVAHSTDLSI